MEALRQKHTRRDDEGKPYDKSRVPKGVSLLIRNVSLVDQDDLPLIESIVKTYNSVSRCAFKRFKSIGLVGMIKSHPLPDKRKIAMFRSCQNVDGKQVGFESPAGMSDKMWFETRRDAYVSRRRKALQNANPFW